MGNFKTFSIEDDQLIIDLPGDLPDNLRCIRSILGDLDMCDGETFIEVLEETAEADPIHLCRMVKHGLLEDLDEFGDTTRRIKMDLHVPLKHEGVHVGECAIHLITNDVSFGHYQDFENLDVESIQQDKLIEMDDIINKVTESDEDGETVLKQFFQKNARNVISENVL